VSLFKNTSYQALALNSPMILSMVSMSLTSALEVAVGEGFPSIISCVPGKLAYLEAEQSLGPPPRFILKRK
jgi:hypothetical protein